MEFCVYSGEFVDEMKGYEIYTEWNFESVPTFCWYCFLFMKYIQNGILSSNEGILHAFKKS